MHRSRQFHLLAAAAFMSWSGLCVASTATVTPTNNRIGSTPQYLGYNMGHYLPGSNTTAWVQYSEANGYRVWAAASYYEPNDDKAPFGDGVADLASFNARKSALRVNPLDTSYINWPYFNNRFQNFVQTGTNEVVLDYTLSQLKSIGVQPLMQIQRTTALNTWGDKWEFWQHQYAQTFYEASQYGAYQYQMYNEPDLTDDEPNPMADWVTRLQLASDAVRSAIADVNRIYGKSLVAEVSAPVLSGGASKFNTWGQAALGTLHTDYQGQTVDYRIFDTFDIHNYNTTGTTYASDLAYLKTVLPAGMPVVYTEFNRYTTSTFSSRTDSLETPANFTDIGNILISAMSQDVRAMYAFKFSQTTGSAAGNQPYKTGFYYVDETTVDPAAGKPLDNVTGATHAAEVMRLASRAFAGGLDRLGTGGSASNSNFTSAATLNSDRGNYYVYAANKNSTDNCDVTLDLSQWDVAPGTVVSIEEVSSRHMGEVTRLVTVPQNRVVTFTMPAMSVALATAPKGPAKPQLSLVSVADATVKNTAPNANFGSAPDAMVHRNANDTDDAATYVKFDVGAIPANATRAVLQLTGSNVANNALTILHVYGLLGDNWSESSLTFANAPDLVAQPSMVRNVGTDAFPVGHLTFDATTNQWGVDVTDFVRSHPDAALTFLVARERRFNTAFAGVDDDTSRIRLFTRESGAATAPRLLLDYVPQATAWKTDANGDFSGGANWTNGAPVQIAPAVTLGPVITAPRALNVAVPHTLASLAFDSAQPYTLAGPARLTLANLAGVSALSVLSGSHTIAVPVQFSGNSLISLSSGTALTIQGSVTGSLGSLSMGAGSTLDIAINTLRVNATPDMLLGLLSGAYNHGRWDLAGITSSAARTDPSHATTLGYAADGGAFTIRYTWYGDLNLDGVVNAADVASMDPAGTTWAQGDLNFDRRVTPDDYALFSLGAAASAGRNISTLVPEPTTALFLALLAFRRRR